MSGESYYKLFGISQDANEDEIKSAYKRLAKIHHPDKNKSPESVKKFQEIQEAYTYLLQHARKIKNKNSEENNYPEQDDEYNDEDKWYEYRKNAWNKYQERLKKQKEELDRWYQRLRSGWNRKVFIFIVVLSTLINLLLLVDYFLPYNLELDKVVRYSEVLYKSMDNHPVSVIETEHNRELWLNSFNNAYFDRNPFISIKTTRIFHHPVETLVQSDTRIYHIPVHFNFYWAQLLIQSMLLIPLFFLFYRKNDAYFIMGHYVTLYIFGGLILYFLFTENRIIHLITLGYI